MHVPLGQAPAAELAGVGQVANKLLQGAQLGRQAGRGGCRCRWHVAALGASRAVVAPATAAASRWLVNEQVLLLRVVEHRVRGAHERGVRHARKVAPVEQVRGHLAQRGLGMQRGRRQGVCQAKCAADVDTPAP